jgi:hypothetical protein
MPKSNRLAAGETKLCTSTAEREDKFTMDSRLRGNDVKRRELDSGLTSSAVESRRNDEQKSGGRAS